MRSKNLEDLAGVSNPLFDGSTVSIPGPGASSRVEASNSVSGLMEDHKLERSIMIPMPETAPARLHGRVPNAPNSVPAQFDTPTRSKDQQFKRSWDHLDSYIERRKSMTGPVITGTSAFEYGRSSPSDKKRRCKIGRTVSLFFLTVAALSMIAAIFGVVTAEIFVKRGYFTRGLRARLDPVPEELTTPTEEPHYDYTTEPYIDADWAWLDDEYKTTTTPPSSNLTAITSQTPTDPTILNKGTVWTTVTSQISTRVPTTETTTQESSLMTTLPTLETTGTAADDNVIPDMVKLLTLPGPLQRFPKNSGDV